MVTLIDKQTDVIVRSLYEGVASKQKLEKIGACAAGKHAVADAPSIPSVLKAFYKFFSEICQAFPDYELKIDNLIEKENKIMVRYIIRGTHRGRFRGSDPTHEKMDIRGIDIFRLQNGKIIYHWTSAYQMSALINP